MDVLIVGGGPAGLSTALHLHAAAPRVRCVVLEKATYPREKICAGGIGARAFRLLEKIDVDVACPAVRLDAIGLRTDTELVRIDEPGCGAVVRRAEFDHALAKVARARGIELREGACVSRVAVDGAGVAVTLDGGEVLRARILVGADGVGGVVRRQLGLPRGELRAQVVELDTEGVAIDATRDTAVFDFATRALRGYAWDFPTLVDGVPLVCRGVYSLGVAADAPGARIDEYLRVRGLDPARYRHKQFAEKGLAPGEPISAPRVILVGEAAGIDICTGEGIGQAIEYGSLAAPYLARALADDRLDFADWRRVVDRAHLGLQMLVRHTAYRVFYGRGRATVERMLPRIPALLRAGIQDFAGLPVSRLGLARGAAQFVAAAAALGLR
ncbi:MAG TPA: NAD(P)/FAD-dependent oxidoreductase [Kofleriaceae bacterium]